MAALFGTTLAPTAGQYGVVAGILAGFLHMSLVTNIGFLHAGMNLYNNRFFTVSLRRSFAQFLMLRRKSNKHRSNSSTMISRSQL